MNEETGEQSSVGQRLIALREQKGLTLQDMVQRLRFSPHQLQLLEAGDYDALPDIMFVRALVRTYARQLGEPPEVLLAQLERERQDARPPHLTPLFSPSVPPKKHRTWGQEISTFWKQVPRAFSMGVLLIMVILGVAGMVGWKTGVFSGKNLLEVVTVVHSSAPRSSFSNALPPLESAPVLPEPARPLPAGNVSEENRMPLLSDAPPVYPAPLQGSVTEKP
ncbi:helix-turn-helix domain-containing protein [Ferrovum myxofaciens]|jgi:cytoskeleton protein RodZ|uniref:Helix-turn-helix domain-containing protein n=3 Tax=root TaxID=1 RepID=A0A9E6SYG0_9PROT|nr:helix-turn-helix domain-containing protein [Ferrovum myxofaciens]MBU6994140.1 helix-turn-helix domain-containing protein [Ferrovum myxofaciens]QKE38081.1 MAG: helix-turn-helix domain-containing protein [Ferrovum myxofaciens]QWY75801.1 MAG: helix-turn-helix domain-containing protein [Ferrovum myxofaciens]QWY78532.1 MAG: helix-turn-helix domain-containing protein [Ferrovum myxofaciens]